MDPASPGGRFLFTAEDPIEEVEEEQGQEEGQQDKASVPATGTVVGAPRSGAAAPSRGGARAVPLDPLLRRLEVLPPSLAPSVMVSRRQHAGSGLSGSSSPRGSGGQKRSRSTQPAAMPKAVVVVLDSDEEEFEGGDKVPRLEVSDPVEKSSQDVHEQRMQPCPAEHQGVESSDDSDSETQSPLEPGHWACLHCTMHNADPRVSCEACEADRHVGGASGADGKSSTRNKSSSRSNNSNSKSSKQPKAERKVAAVRDGPWECLLCTVSNPVSATVCSGCENLRPPGAYIPSVPTRPKQGTLSHFLKSRTVPLQSPQQHLPSQSPQQQQPRQQQPQQQQPPQQAAAARPLQGRTSQQPLKEVLTRILPKATAVLLDRDDLAVVDTTSAAATVPAGLDSGADGEFAPATASCAVTQAGMHGAQARPLGTVGSGSASRPRLHSQDALLDSSSSDDADGGALRTVASVTTKKRVAAQLPPEKPGKSRKVPLSSPLMSKTGAGAGADAWPEACVPWFQGLEPRSSEELCVAMHKNKVQEIQQWLEGAAAGRHPQRVLLLHGPSGAGKSTSVRVLARELGLSVREWSAESDRANTLLVGSEPQAQPRSDLYVPYVSQVQDFDMFVRQARFPALRLMDSSGGSGSGSGSGSGQVSLLLIDSLPYLQGDTQLATFHRALQRLVAPSPPQLARRPQQQQHRPIAVIVHSSDGEAANPSELRKLYSAAVVDSPQTQLMGVLKVPPTRMATVLKGAAERMRLPTLVPAQLDKLVSAADGDVRAALLALEFASVGSSKAAAVPVSAKGPEKSGSSAARRSLSVDKGDKGGKAAMIAGTGVGVGEEDDTGRDSSLSMLHAVGKLLRGKTVGEAFDDLSAARRSKQASVPDEAQRRQLNYDPDKVAALCELDAGGLSDFVQFNCPTHFTEVGELSLALDALSAGDELMAAARHGSSSTCTTGLGRTGRRSASRGQGGAGDEGGGWAFPGNYVQSIAARCVAAVRTIRPAAGGERFGSSAVLKPQLYDSAQRRAAERARQRDCYPAGLPLLSSSAQSEYWAFAPRLDVAGGAVRAAEMDAAACELPGDAVSDF